jgi:hypothetical protein
MELRQPVMIGAEVYGGLATLYAPLVIVEHVLNDGVDIRLS